MTAHAVPIIPRPVIIMESETQEKKLGIALMEKKDSILVAYLDQQFSKFFGRYIFTIKRRWIKRAKRS